MINIQTRTITDDLASLVKQLDKVVSDNGDKKLAAVLNFIDLEEEEVAKFAEKNEIKNVALVVTDQKNADRFNVNEDVVSFHPHRELRVRERFACLMLSGRYIELPTVPRTGHDATRQGSFA